MKRKPFKQRRPFAGKPRKQRWSRVSDYLTATEILEREEGFRIFATDVLNVKLDHISRPIFDTIIEAIENNKRLMLMPKRKF